MVNFKELWDGVETFLKTKAALIGVVADSIQKGEIGTNITPATPFVLIYCLPDDSVDDNSGNLIRATATIAIFVGVEPNDNSANAIISCMELAGRVRTALTTYEILCSTNAPVPEEISANYTVISFEYTAFYDPYQDLLS